MDRRLSYARGGAVAALVCLVPTVAAAARSAAFIPLGILETAVLALVTAYAVFVGIYRYPR